jgi:hypothetical protein
MSETELTRSSIFCADFLVWGKVVFGSAARSGVAAGSRLKRTEARAADTIVLSADLAFRDVGRCRAYLSFPR